MHPRRGEQHLVTVGRHQRATRHDLMAPVTEELQEGPSRFRHVHGIVPFWFPAPERNRWRGHDHKGASEPFPVASAKFVRSGSGNRRADSSRGRADETDLHLSTVSRSAHRAKGICPRVAAAAGARPAGAALAAGSKLLTGRSADNEEEVTA